MNDTSSKIKRTPYGIVNGVPVYCRDEYVFKSRHRGPIEDDADLLIYAEKVTSGWQSGGWTHRFVNYYLSDYALSEPYASLTLDEFRRLKEIQELAKEAEKATEMEHRWRCVKTLYWADNSVEEVWEDRYGNRKTVQSVGPHGDSF